jgi:hypothetical protein
MSSKDDYRPEEEEEVGAIDPRRGHIPTEAPEDEGIDTGDLEADRKESDETENKGAKASTTASASAGMEFSGLIPA